MDVHELDRVDFEFEEDARGAAVVLQNAGVVRNTVLVCVQRFGAWGDVGRWDYMHKVLIRDKVFVCDFERAVEGLDDIGEIGTEGELCDHMGEVHGYTAEIRI